MGINKERVQSNDICNSKLFTEYILSLQNKGLKVTSHRLTVLKCFSYDNPSLTLQGIQKAIDIYMDRATLYRILTLFTQKFIISRLNDSQVDCYYILNRQTPGSKVYNLLVKCERCQKIYTLPQPPDSYIEILKKYHIQPNILVNGLCEHCNHD